MSDKIKNFRIQNATYNHEHDWYKNKYYKIYITAYKFINLSQLAV